MLVVLRQRLILHPSRWRKCTNSCFDNRRKSLEEVEEGAKFLRSEQSLLSLAAGIQIIWNNYLNFFYVTVLTYMTNSLKTPA